MNYQYPTQLPPQFIIKNEIRDRFLLNLFLHFDTTESWAFSLRNRLQSKFIRAVETLGNHWEKSGQLDKAVECYRKSLEKNDLAKEIYRRLMACYLQLGQKSEAQRTYDRYRETLSASLGIEPSPETEALRKEITAL